MNSDFQHKKPRQQGNPQERQMQPLPKMEQGTKGVVTKQHIEELSKSEDSTAFSELVKLSKHPNKGIRRAVVEAFSIRKEEESINAIIYFLKNDSSWVVKRKAAETLGQKDMAGVPALMIALQQDICCHVREAAADALGRLKAKEATAALRAAMESDENVEVRTAATKALKAIEE